MAWTENLDLDLSSVVSTIGTNLVSGGWTCYDADPYFVYTSTNNQGVTQYLQISQSGSYTYIQLKGWLSWNNGTHVGTSGSDDTMDRLHFNAAALGGTVHCNLYMSVTSNRAIIIINTPSSRFTSWGYFGGLDSLAGTNDPTCCMIITSYTRSAVYYMGTILSLAGGTTEYWKPVYTFSYWGALGSIDGPSPYIFGINQMSGDFAKQLLLPIFVQDYAYAYTASYGGYGSFRGQFDGLLYCPLGGGLSNWYNVGLLSNLDTIDVDGQDYLAVLPYAYVGAHRNTWFGGLPVNGLAVIKA